MPTYPNSVQGIDRLERLLARAEALIAPASTTELLLSTDLEVREGRGALKMLEVEGVLHARNGGRNQILWYPGQRPVGERPPSRRYDTMSYRLARDTLQRNSASSIPTDALRGREDRHTFLGGLKMLVAMRKVRWVNQTRQIIAWQWIAADGGGHRY